MSSQTTSTLVMISPDSFGFNEETAGTNSFQNRLSEDRKNIRDKAVQEFEGAVAKLRGAGMRVITLPSPPHCPDAVFPNNWFSTHEDGTVYLYPMATPNRRAERQEGVLHTALAEAGYTDLRFKDMTSSELDGMHLEGTGSLVLDRVNKIAYAVESPRTHTEVFHAWCQSAGYTPVLFHSFDGAGKPIYHTNVMMAVGSEFVVICMDSVRNTDMQELLSQYFAKYHQEVITITYAQMSAYCGNLLEVENERGERIIVMSKTAYHAFTPEQRVTLEKYGKILTLSIPTIETIGGGSARCMLAEIFLPRS